MTETPAEEATPQERIFWGLLQTAGRRIRKSPYFGWFIVFIFAQFLFLYGVNNDLFLGILSYNGYEEAQTAFFIVSVNALLAINTMVFLLQVTPLLSSIDGHKALNKKDQAIMKEARQTFVCAMVIAAVLSALIAFLIILKMSGSLIWTWRVVLELSEDVGVVVFGFFLIADLCCLETSVRVERYKPALEGVDLKKIGELKRSLQRYLLAVDAPGFIGILIIVISSHVLFHSVQFNYWEGFIAGAIGLHIMFSQVALLLLSALEEGDST